MNFKKIRLGFLIMLLGASSCGKQELVSEQHKDINGLKDVNINASFSGMAFVHPGVGFSGYDLARMKTNLNTEPWKSGYAALAGSTTGSANYTMQGPFVTVGREPDLNLSQYSNDSEAVLYQAIQYYMTGNTAFAQKAVQIINAWTTTHTTWSGGTPFLAASDYGLNIIMGAEILRYNYPGWTSTETNHCNAYFSNVLWPQFGVGMQTVLRSANQGAAQLKGAMAVAVFLSDTTKFRQVIDAWHNDACGGFTLTSLVSGQVADSGRDQGHALGEIQNLAWVAETAWKQDLDLFGELSNRLKAEMEYFCSYNLGNNVPFTTFGACYGLYTTVGSSGRGTWNWAPMACEIINGAYNIRKGISNPYTTSYLATLVPNADTFLWKKDGLAPPSAPASPAPANWLFPFFNTVAVTSLTDSDIGTVGLAGSAAYSSGIWTVSGSGADIWSGSDSFNFAYKQLNGDGEIVALVTSQSNTNASAKAGIMIRETLAANSKYAVVYMKQTNGAEFVQKSATGGTYVNLQSHAPATPLPYYLKLERRGQLITAYNSFDGSIWTPMRVVDAPMNSTVYVGLAVCAHNNSALCTATFTNVAISGAPSTNRAIGGTANADRENVSQIAGNAFDGSSATKWYTQTVGSNGWLQYHFAGTGAYAVNQYQVTSANDVPQRDPKDWQFQGSNDGTTWTTLDIRTGQSFARLQTVTYTISNTTLYRYYRLNVTANSGGAAYGIQLSELALLAP